MQTELLRQALLELGLLGAGDDVRVDGGEWTYRGRAGRLQLVSDPRRDRLWIRWLEVDASQRRCGVGRALEQVAQAVARGLGLTRLLVFPLHAAQTFWVHLGYGPHARTARVLVRNLARDVHKQRV